MVSRMFDYTSFAELSREELEELHEQLMDKLEDLNFERRFAVAGPGLKLTDEQRASLDHEFDDDAANLTSQLAEVDRLLASRLVAWENLSVGRGCVHRSRERIGPSTGCDAPSAGRADHSRRA